MVENFSPRFGLYYLTLFIISDDDTRGRSTEINHDTD